MVLEQDLVIILEAMRIIAIALSAITPSLCKRIYTQLGYSEDQFNAATWVSLSLSLARITYTSSLFDRQHLFVPEF